MFKRKMVCVHCNKEGMQPVSSTGKYCNNRCQVDAQYAQFILAWKRGELTGLVGKRGISAHIRRYMFEKYNSKCCICGWCTPHPTDGKIPLEVDHIDGNWLNTTEENLQLLCPCCHALTPTYKSQNKNSTRAYK